MESLISLPDYIKRDYDPFANPPDFSIALQHRKATLVGHSNTKIKSKLCECCMLPINKQPIDLRCGHLQLSFLGTSLVMYFNLLKISIILLAVISIPLAVLQAIVLNKHYLCCLISTQILVSLSMEKDGRFIFIVTSWISLTGLAYLLKRYSQKEIYIIQNSHPIPEDYTLKLSNLPNTDQRQLKKLVQLSLCEKVTNIDFAYDIHQLHQAFLKREKLTIQKNRIEKSTFKNGIGLFSPQRNNSQINSRKSHLLELNNDINRLDQTLSKYKHYLTFTPYKQIGIGFVSFESKSAARSAFNRYQTLTTGNSKQQLRYKQKEIFIEFAMNPKDIVWQNLNFEDTKINKYIQLAAIFVGLSFIIFLILFLTKYRGMRTVFSLNPKFVAFTSIFVIYSLFHLMVHLLVLVKRKIAKYSTHTDKQMSSLRIYLILNTAFTCILPYLLYSNEEQLILYINFVTFLDAFIHPLIKIFNCNHIYQKMLAEYIKNLQPCKNYYTQEYINRLLEGRQFRLGQNYHFLCRAIFVTSFFSIAAPLCYIYYTFALVIQYIAQKILLLRVSKTPPKISKNIVYFVVSYLFYAPAFFFLGTGLLKVQKEPLYFINYLSEILGLLLSFALAQINLITGKKDDNVGEKDCYFISKTKFGQLYQTQNPIKKYDGSNTSIRSLPSQKICSTPQWRDFQYFEEDRNKVETHMSQMRSINRLMSYNNDYFDLFISSEYKRFCDT